MKVTLESFSVLGWRSIKALRDFSPQSINILIGPNGAGKSNFIGFFNLLSWMLSGQLQERITQRGGCNDLLFDGTETTQRLEGEQSIRLMIEPCV